MVISTIKMMLLLLDASQKGVSFICVSVLCQAKLLTPQTKLKQNLQCGWNKLFMTNKSGNIYAPGVISGKDG